MWAEAKIRHFDVGADETVVNGTAENALERLGILPVRRKDAKSLASVSKISLPEKLPKDGRPKVHIEISHDHQRTGMRGGKGG